MGGAKGAFLRRIDCGGNMDATEEGRSKVYLFRAAVDKYSDSNDTPPKFAYGTDCLFNRASGSQDVINNENTFARRNVEIASEYPCLSHFFRKDTPYS